MSDRLISEARVETALAQRYLTQLCKHFEHRFAVSQGGGAGNIAFPFGTCRLEAAPDLLILRAEVRDPALLEQLESVVARHLERFAFRDTPAIVWNRADA